MCRSTRLTINWLQMEMPISPKTGLDLRSPGVASQTADWSHVGTWQADLPKRQRREEMDKFQMDHQDIIVQSPFSSPCAEEKTPVCGQSSEPHLTDHASNIDEH